MKLKELGRRAVACPRWRWMPGMAVLRYHPGTPFHGQRQTRVDDDLVTYEQALNVHIIPDLSDPATLGCLLHLVREAYSDELIFTVYDSGYWFVENQHGLMAQKNTEAEALVRVLESAP